MTCPAPAPSITAAASPVSDSIELLNSECFCLSLDAEALRRALESEIGQLGLFDLIQQRCPYLFSTRPAFVSHAHMTRMAQVVHAIDSVGTLPAYRAEILANSPPISRYDPRGAEGVFFNGGAKCTAANVNVTAGESNAVT